MRAGNQHRANRGAAQARSGSLDGSDPANRIARTPARPAVRTRLDRRLLGTATRMNRRAAARATRGAFARIESVRLAGVRLVDGF